MNSKWRFAYGIRGMMVAASSYYCDSFSVCFSTLSGIGLSILHLLGGDYAVFSCWYQMVFQQHVLHRQWVVVIGFAAELLIETVGELLLTCGRLQLPGV